MTQTIFIIFVGAQLWSADLFCQPNPVIKLLDTLGKSSYLFNTLIYLSFLFLICPTTVIIS